jgi:hypothetical protein
MAGITPMRQGDTYPPAMFIFKDDNGNIVPLPAGSTFTLEIYNPKDNSVRAGIGTFDTTQLSSGKVIYSWNSNDTAVVGTFSLYIKFVTPSSGTGSSDPISWTILPLFVQQ